MYIFHGNLGATAPSAAVKRLQTSLTQLAELAAQPGLNPGKIDGIVGAQTLAATSAALRFISPRLPTKAVRVSVDALSLALPFVPDAAKHVTARADEIASAINLMIATTGPAVPAAVAPSVPWWQTTAGRGGLLAVAGLLTVVLVMKKYRSGPTRPVVAA